MSAVLPIRPPLLSRVWVALFGCLWCATTLSLAVRAAPHGPAALAPFLMTAFGGALGIRLLLVEAAPRPDGLLVRNALRSRLVPREDIEGALLLRDGGPLELEASAGPVNSARSLSG